MVEPLQGRSPPLPCLVALSLVEVEIKYLICHVTKQSHVIEGTCNFMSGNSSRYVTTLLSLVAIDIVEAEIRF